MPPTDDAASVGSCGYGLPEAASKIVMRELALPASKFFPSGVNVSAKVSRRKPLYWRVLLPRGRIVPADDRVAAAGNQQLAVRAYRNRRHSTELVRQSGAQTWRPSAPKSYPDGSSR